MGRNIVIYSGYDDSDYLAHHGVKGMKWGVRKRGDSDGNQRKGLSKKAKIAIGAGAAAATVAGGIVANSIIKKKTGGAYNLATMTKRGLSSVGRKLKRTPVDGPTDYDRLKRVMPDGWEPRPADAERLKTHYTKVNHTKVNHTKVNHTKLNHTKLNHTKLNHTKVNHTKVNYVKYDPNKFRYNKFRYNGFKI